MTTTYNVQRMAVTVTAASRLMVEAIEHNDLNMASVYAHIIADAIDETIEQEAEI